MQGLDTVSGEARDKVAQAVRYEQQAGTALRDGVRGESIPVRNLSSKRVIEGVVHEPGVVFVGRAPAKL